MDEIIDVKEEAMTGIQTEAEACTVEEVQESTPEIPYADAAEVRRGARAFSRVALAPVVFSLLATVTAALIMTVGRHLLDSFDTRISDKIFGSVYFSAAMQVLLAYGICFWGYRLALVGMPVHRVEKRTIPVKKFLLIAVVAIGATQVAATAASFIDGIISAITPGDDGLVLFDNSPLWVNLLITVILAPIFEELMFRRLMFDRISKYGDVLAIIFTSVAFGIFHGNLYQFIYTTVVGAVIGYSYAISRRIIYPILLHMMLNLYASLPTVFDSIFGGAGLGENLSELNAAEALAAVGSIVTYLLYSMLSLGFAGGAVAIVIVVLVKRKLEIPKNGEVRLTGFGISRAVILNAGCMIFATLGLYDFIVYYATSDPIFDALAGLLKGLIG